MKTYHEAMMQTAFVWAKQSYCKRRQVGAVISVDNRIVSTGFNGTISGHDNCCENEESCNCITYIGNGEYFALDTCEKCKGTGIILSTNEFTLHAEANALAFCLRNGISTKGASIYITDSPCVHCSKLIAQAGITEVYYSREYHDLSGIEFLKKCNVKIKRVGNDI